MLEAFAETKHIMDAEKRKAFLKFVNSSLSRAALANMMHLAKKKVRQASTNDFDRDPWALNTENGTVDLRSGALRPHRAEDVLCKMIPLRYDQHAEWGHTLFDTRLASHSAEAFLAFSMYRHLGLAIAFEDIGDCFNDTIGLRAQGTSVDPTVLAFREQKSLASFELLTVFLCGSRLTTHTTPHESSRS